MWTELPTVQNPERGCGELQAGGFYAQGEAGPGGILNRWTWLLGSGVEGQKNYYWSPKARGQEWLHLPASLATGDLLPAEYEYRERAYSQHPHPALLDHVGGAFYTPASFASECMRYGPSLRIDPQMARTLAGGAFLPLLVVFTHNDMPVVDIADDLLMWVDPDMPTTDLWYRPTPERQGFGFTVRATDYGARHWLVPVLEALDARMTETEVRAPWKLLPDDLQQRVSWFQQPFGASWLTNIRYVVTGEEEMETLEQLAALGIEPVRKEQP